MCKVYHRDIPRVLENHYIKNRNIHDYATWQTDYIHIVHADTNRCNMTMRFQGGKVWNYIVKNKIPYDEAIYIFKHEYQSFLLNYCYTCGAYHYMRKNIASDVPPPVILILHYYPDNNFHWAHIGPTWVLSAPDGPHVGPMNLAIRVVIVMVSFVLHLRSSTAIDYTVVIYQ